MELVLKALDSPRRRAILRLVWDEERPAGDIHRALGDVTFGAVSQQLRLLTEAGLTEVRRDGQRRLYRARRGHLGPLEAWLESMWDDSLERLASLSESEAAAAKPAGQRKLRRRP